MTIVSQVTELLQGVLADSMDELARETGYVKRERKFSGSTLLGTLVFTVLRNPTAKPCDYQTTAAQLGVLVTETAIAKRFTPPLLKFLEAALLRVLRRALTAGPPPVELLNRFTQVAVGDSSTITLPDEYADQFPGCGGSHDSGKAALKLQVLWDLRHGTLHVLVEPGPGLNVSSADSVQTSVKAATGDQASSWGIDLAIRRALATSGPFVTLPARAWSRPDRTPPMARGFS